MKISVITAVYNAKDTITEAIESVLSQDYSDVELVVIDGASTDGTTKLLQAYRDKITVFISEPDEGIYDALNKGIRHATGDIVGFLHADDLFASESILSNIADMFCDASVDAVYGDLEYISQSEQNKVIRYWHAGEFSAGKLAQGWMPPHPTFYVRRAHYTKLGAFDTSYRIAADYDCMLRLLSNPSFRCAYIPQVLVRMRVGGESNRSLKNITRKSLEDHRALKKNKIGGWHTLLLKNIRKLPQFFSRSQQD